MNKIYLFSGVVILLLGVAVYGGLHYKKMSAKVTTNDANVAASESAMQAKVPEPQKIYADGVLTKEVSDAKPGTWYVEMPMEGDQTGVVELAFDDASMCLNDETLAPCTPDTFAEKRPVHIEGVINGETMKVTELIFVHPTSTPQN